jgi:hypothetical protein
MATPNREHDVAPIIKYVKKADGDFFTIAEVAAECDRSVDRVRKVIRKGLVEGPKHRMTLSPTAYVWLYTREDIERIKKFFGDIHMGRPKNE